MKRATIDQLPSDLRAWLIGRLRARGFAGYREVAAELRAELHRRRIPLQLSLSALQRFGSVVHQRVGGVAEAVALMSAIRDDEGALLHGAERLAEAALIRELLDGSGPLDWMRLASASQSLARLSRAGLAQEQLRQKIRERPQPKDDRPKGLSDETVDLIKRKILGIEPERTISQKSAPALPAPGSNDQADAPSRQEPPQTASTRREALDSEPSDPPPALRGPILVPVSRRRKSRVQPERRRGWSAEELD